jgi:hypothetical protein
MNYRRLSAWPSRSRRSPAPWRLVQISGAAPARLIANVDQTD